MVLRLLTYCSITVFLALLSPEVHSQCGDSIDLGTWIKEGVAANGNWGVIGGGNSVNQTINGEPTFYVSPDSFINVVISGDIRVNTTADDDWIGFVFGYQDPDTSNASNYDFYLFDWKQADQTFSGYFGAEGYALSRINGPITNLPEAFAGKAGPYVNLIGSQFSNADGWNDQQTYSFALTYTNTRTVIEINGDTLFDIYGCFPPGRFGFYNYSQSDVTYSNFSYRVAAAFQVLTPDVCIEDTAKFLALSDSCTNAAGVQVNNTIVGWEWDFGDGSAASFDTNATHVYDTAGVYNVRLIVTDYLGCKDTAYSDVEVFQNTIALNLDTAICSHDTINLDAGAGYTAYAWSTGSAGQTAQANVSGQYFVTVTDILGCEAIDTVEITHLALPTVDLGVDTMICNHDSHVLEANTSPVVSYLWNDGSTEDTLLIGATGSYYCVVTDSNTCYNSDTIEITNYAQPIVSPPNPELCYGDTITISASGANTYEWYPNYALSSTIGTVVETYTLLDTTYFVIGTDTNGCVDTSSFFVDVHDLPTVSISGGDSICEGDSIELTFALTGAGPWDLTYTLNGTPITVNGIAANSYSFYTSDSGLYIPTFISDINCSNEGVDSTVVSVQPLPNMAVTASSDSLCFADSIQINASGASTYSWLPTTGLNNPALATVMASPSASIDYVVTGTSSFGCIDSTNILVEVLPLPVLTLNITADTICFSDTVQLVATGGGAYNWISAPSALAFSGDTIQDTPSQNTTYKVYVTDSFGCTDSLVSAITVDTLPVVSILPDDTAFCLNDTALLTSFGAETYAWSPLALFGSPSGDSIYISPSDTGFYSVVGTDDNGCKGQDTIEVIIYPLPNVQASVQSADICFGLTDTFTVTGAFTYEWSPNYAISSTSGDNVIVQPSADTTYTVTGTDTNGCISMDTVDVLVLDLPSMALASDTDSICLGLTVALQATGNATSYQWANTPGLSAYNQASVTAQPSSTSSYEVYGTGANGCVDSLDTMITVLPLPVITVTPNNLNASICIGESRELRLSNVYDYQWSPLANLTLDGNNNDTVMANPTDTTVYSITATDEFQCTSDTNFTLNVTPLPVLTLTKSISVSCYRAPNQLSASGANSYSWGPLVFMNGSQTANPTVAPEITQEYFVTATGLGGCQSIDSITVDVFPVPNYSAGEDQAICIGDTTSLNASGGVSYSWQPFIHISNPGISSPLSYPNTSRYYSVKVTDGNGCTFSDDVFITVNPLPAVEAGNRTTICEGESVQLGGDPSGPVGSSFSWLPVTGLSSPSASNPDASPTDTIVYSMLVVDANGCQKSDIVRIDVKPKPDFQVLEKPKYICAGDSSEVKVTEGLQSYQWLPENVVLKPKSATSRVFPATTSTISVVGEGSNGCLNTLDVGIEVKTLPVVFAGVDKSICEGDSVSIAGSASVKKIQWNPLDLVLQPDSLGSIAFPSERTKFTLTATDEFGCKNSDDVQVFVYPYPHTDAGEDIDNCNIQTVYLGSDYTADPNNFITWTPSENLSNPNDPNPYVLSPENVTYYLKVESPEGCVNFDSIYVRSDCYDRVYIPSAFSPNDDKVNDVFLISTYRVLNPSIVVRDKWGHVVFETKDETIGWDGTVKGHGDAPVGVYYVEITYQSEQGRFLGQEGTVSLIR